MTKFSKKRLTCRIFEIFLILGSVVLNRLSFKKMGVMRHMVYRSYVLENAGIFRYIMVAMAIILIIYLILKFKFKVFSFEDVLFVAFFIISILALNKTQIFKYDHYHQSIIYLVSSALQLILIKNKIKQKPPSFNYQGGLFFFYSEFVSCVFIKLNFAIFFWGFYFKYKVMVPFVLCVLCI